MNMGARQWQGDVVDLNIPVYGICCTIDGEHGNAGAIEIAEARFVSTVQNGRKLKTSACAGRWIAKDAAKMIP